MIEGRPSGGARRWEWLVSRKSLLIGTFVVSFALFATASAAAVSPPLPDRMAAIGDSITRAADVCCFYGDHPRKSWATGDDPNDAILSHYERILAGNPGMAGNGFNESVSGAKMSDAPGQAAEAVADAAQYVTILMGANDVCTSSIDSMTPVDVYRSQFQATMDGLAGLPPDAHVFVSSIPSVYRLWQIFHDDPAAQLVWALAQICQSMLSPSNTEADRQLVLQRERDFNDVLAQVCAQYANCRFDRYAVFKFRFARTDVSKLDYFHPNLRGQKRLAAITWARSWWGGAGPSNREG
jgi:lysophospholipase L1-like esterase